MSEKVLLDGQKRVAAVLPDPKCPTNKGNHSPRGGTQGRDLVYQGAPGTSEASAERLSVRERITTPYVRTQSGTENGFEPISTRDAITVMAELVKAAADAFYDKAAQEVRFRRPEGLGVKLYEYQYLENTYAATKLFFQLIGTPNIAFHDRPSIASNTQGFNDSGIDPHGYAYEDIWDSDVLFLAGVNPYESQSVFFMNQMAGKRIIVLDPRRTITADYAEKTGGLHLQPNVLGADTLILNALCRYIRDQRIPKPAEWGASRLRPSLVADEALLKKARVEALNAPPDPDLGPEKARLAQLQLSAAEFLGPFLDSQPDLAEAAGVSGIPYDKLVEAAHFLSGPVSDMPAADSRKVSLIFEKGLIWGYSYQSTAACANLGLLLGSVLDPAAPGAVQPDSKYGVTGRAGGHQKGWAEVRYRLKNPRGVSFNAGYPFYRATDEFVARDGVRIRTHNYLDAHLVGEAVAPRNTNATGPKNPDVRLLWLIGSNAIGQIGNAAAKWSAVANRRGTALPASADVGEIVRTLTERIRNGGLVVVQQDIYPNPTTMQADLVLPASGWGEEDFVRSNGERRLRLYGRFQDSPTRILSDGTREMRCLPDWKIFQAVARALLPSGYRGHGLPAGYTFDGSSRPLSADDFAWSRAAEVFREVALTSQLSSSLAVLEEANDPVPKGHDILRARGSRGFQTPLAKSGGTIQESERTRVRSDRWKLDSGETYGPYTFVAADWGAIRDDFEKNLPRRDKGEFAISNGRINELWNSLFTHIRNETVRARYPDDLPGTVLELSAFDARGLGVDTGDVVEVVADDIHLGARRGAFKGVVVVQTDALPSGMVFAYFSYPVSSTRSDAFPYRAFVTDGYVNNITTGYVDPINPIAAVKFARGRIVPTGGRYVPSSWPSGLNARPRHVAFAQARVTHERQRSAWKLREIIVQKGLPRFRRHVGALTPSNEVIADLILEPDVYVRKLSSPDAEGQALRDQLSAAVSWMRWRVDGQVVDQWTDKEQRALRDWLTKVIPLE
jgi:arsenite oxidase large subunit